MSVYLINDLKNLYGNKKISIGDVVNVDCKKVSFNVKVANNGSKYGDLVLGDKEATLNAKYWGISENAIAFLNDSNYIRCTVTVDEFNGVLQLKISKIFSIPESEFNLSKLDVTAPEPVESLVSYLEERINEIEDEAIKLIVERRYAENKEKFDIWPAARSHHHNYRSGLLYHTVSMLRLANNNLRQYPNSLDKDILYGAIILHDMDKIREYSSVDSPQFTELGELYGHIFLSGAETYHHAKLISKENPEINLSKIKHLIHSILAHHGKKEWGSPVEPQTIEAEIIHQIDMMDSRMNKKYK